MLDGTQTIEKQFRGGERSAEVCTRPRQRSALSPAWLRFVLIVLLAGGAFFRFAYLDKKVYWHDEACTSLRISGARVHEVREELGDREIGIHDVHKYQHVNPERGVVSSVVALALDDAQHPPFYYGLVRLWAGWLGDSVATVRSLSAFLSLLAFPCLYWLGRELFEKPLTAWVAIALLAVSPFHVLYAQEAREYSFLTVVILLSSAALLRALRLQAKTCWALYAFTVALGLYTSLVFGIVAVAHGMYVAGASFRMGSWQRFPWPKAIKDYLAATLVGFAAFAPWAAVVMIHMTQVSGGLAWMAEDKSLFGLLDGWCFGVCSVFLDLVPQRESLLAFALRLPAVVLVVGSFCFLYSRTRPKTWLLIFSLIGVTWLATVVPDLVLGGRRSCYARFALPCYVAVGLSVAHLLATGITSPRPWQRKAWQVVLVGLIGGGLVSNVLSAQAVRWWNKGHNNTIPLAANVINQSRRPLVLSDSGPVHFGNFIALSHLLEPGVRLWLMLDSKVPTIPDGFSDVFLFKPSGPLRGTLEASGYQVQLTSAPGLCRLQRPVEPLREPGSLENPSP